MTIHDIKIVEDYDGIRYHKIDNLPYGNATIIARDLKKHRRCYNDGYFTAAIPITEVSLAERDRIIIDGVSFARIVEQEK